MDEIKYEQALAELEEIARKMENGGYDIDQLSASLKRAQQLITLCRAKLQKTDEGLQEILQSFNTVE